MHATCTIKNAGQLWLWRKRISTLELFPFHHGYMTMHCIKIACILLVSASLVHAEPVVFDFQDFAELGNIKHRIEGVYPDLELNIAALAGDFAYIDTAAGIATSSLTFADRGVAKAGAFLSDALTLMQSPTYETMEDAASGFSFIDLSELTDGLSEIGNHARAIESTVFENFTLPDNDWFVAGVTSGRARDEMIKVRDAAEQGRSILGELGTQVVGAVDSLNNLSAHYAHVVRDLNQLNKVLSETSWTLGPLASPVLAGTSSAAANALFVNIHDIPQARDAVLRLADPVADRLSELGELINAIDNVLASETLPSRWHTTITPPPSSQHYSMVTRSKQFTSGATEIDGEFLIGEIIVTNIVDSPPCDDGLACVDIADVTFTAQREVDVPGLGLQSTSSDVILPMTYVATPNLLFVADDYFAIPAIGKNMHIPEGGSVFFQIWAEYNSPLVISSFRVVNRASTPGFYFTDIVPEPSTIILILSLAMTSICRRR